MCVQHVLQDAGTQNGVIQRNIIARVVGTTANVHMCTHTTIITLRSACVAYNVAFCVVKSDRKKKIYNNK